MQYLPWRHDTIEFFQTQLKCLEKSAGLQGAKVQHGAAARLRGCMIRVHVEWLSHQQATKREITLEPKWRKIRTSWLRFWLFLSTNCANNLTLHLWKATRSQLKQATRAESSRTWAPPTSLAGGTRRHHGLFFLLIKGLTDDSRCSVCLSR